MLKKSMLQLEIEPQTLSTTVRESYLPSFSQASRQCACSHICMYFVALITRESLQQSKSDSLEMIAMPSGTNKLFLQAYTCCSSTRMPERHGCQIRQPYIDIISYNVLKGLNRLVVSEGFG